VLIDVVGMGEEWNKFVQKIVHLQSDLPPFYIELLDTQDFKKQHDNLLHDVGSPYQKIYITGYFSETSRDTLEKIIKRPRIVKLISPDLNLNKPRERKNFQVLEKLAKAGAELRFNHRLHARFLVAHNPERSGMNMRGFLLIGSFDFNRDCIGLERYDAGIRTRHPDLVKSAVELFEKIWNTPESLTLEEFKKEKK